MIRQCGGHRHIFIPHHRATRPQLVGVNERHKRNAPFVANSHVDVVLVHVEEEARHLFERRGAPGIDARLQAGRPSEPNQVPVVGVVV